MSNLTGFLGSAAIISISVFYFQITLEQAPERAIFSLIAAVFAWAFAAARAHETRERYVRFLLGGALGAACAALAGGWMGALDTKTSFSAPPEIVAIVAQFQGEQKPGAVRTVISGADRRALAAETRRFAVIQVILPSDEAAPSGVFDEGTWTVEALRLYFDRLKDDGFLLLTPQLASPFDLSVSQARLTTLAEAWKKSARRDLDLHAVSVKSSKGNLEAVLVRMKPFLREERERMERLLGANDSQRAYPLVSDASGSVLTDDQPLAQSGIELNRPVFWSLLVAIVMLIAGVSWQERRKELASRWQTASVATYFAGLGLSSAFFIAFFLMRALRTWGVPSMAMGLAMLTILLSNAAGAAFFAGAPGRRSGVRFQPLANFILAVMFTYLGALLFEPLARSGYTWLSALIGMTVIAPFGLFGGAFVPNALEEAQEKLAARALVLVWALYAVGTATGLYAGFVLGLKNGLDAVFLAGLFSFLWVAIFSGLLRPWNVRKFSVKPEERA